MNILQTIGAIAAMIFTVGSMLTMWVFAAAGCANATPESIHRVKIWVINLTIFCLAGIGVGIWLLIKKHYAWSTFLTLLPAATMLSILVWNLCR